MEKDAGLSLPKGVSRRRIVKGIAGLAGLSVLPACGHDQETSTSLRSSYLSAKPKKRLAIIGGGVGGLATAYFCDASWSIDLFESRYKIGGHCDSQLIDMGSETVSVDLGAQFFHADTHPLYMALLSELGLYQASHPERDMVIEAKGSLSIFTDRSQRPQFVSSRPLLTPLNSIDFAIYTQNARKMILDDGSWEITLAEWIDSLWLRSSFKENILVPWLSSLIGAPIDLAMQTSARSILQTFALAFPEHIFKSASTLNSKIGLEGNLRYLLDSCQNLQLHTNSAVQRLEYIEGQWNVVTANRRLSGYDAVVVNAAPLDSRNFLAALPWASDLVEILRRFEYFKTRIVIHTDPAYVHEKHSNWSLHNAGWEGDACEGSVWLGAIHEKLQVNTGIDLFKSWATHRRFEAENILLERSFLHPLLTPSAVQASRQLAAWQGKNGLWFAGQFMTGMDLQEAGVYVAMKVAQDLAGDSPELKSFQARLVREAKTKISYEL